MVTNVLLESIDDSSVLILVLTIARVGVADVSTDTNVVIPTFVLVTVVSAVLIGVIDVSEVTAGLVPLLDCSDVSVGANVVVSTVELVSELTMDVAGAVDVSDLLVPMKVVQTSVLSIVVVRVVEICDVPLDTDAVIPSLVPVSEVTAGLLDNVDGTGDESGSEVIVGLFSLLVCTDISVDTSLVVPSEVPMPVVMLLVRTVDNTDVSVETNVVNTSVVLLSVVIILLVVYVDVADVSVQTNVVVSSLVLVSELTTVLPGDVDGTGDEDVSEVTSGLV